MPREDPVDEPAPEAVREEARVALDRGVTAVAPIERGVNALYRLDLEDGTRAVLKAPRYATDAEFLAEPAVLSLIGRKTAVPVPRVLATTGADEGPLGTASYAMAFLDGREVDGVLGLPPATRERLVREAGAHLAAIHDVRIAGAYGPLQGPETCGSRQDPETDGSRRDPERYGPLQVAGEDDPPQDDFPQDDPPQDDARRLTDGDLRVAPPFESWDALFEELVEEVTAALLGEGPLTDAEPRFADLEPGIRRALAGDRTAVADASPPPAIVVRDYRPANLVLAADDDADPIVRGVFDVGGLVGDGLLDVARTETALIDVPLGGTAEAASLRTAFRAAYAEGRDDGRALFDERYPCYRLYALAYRLKAFDYSVRFAREADPDAVARRWRSSVADRVAEIRGDR